MEIEPLRSGEQMAAAARLLSEVWGHPLIDAAMLRSLAHSGNYVAGAFADGELAGVSVAFFGARSGRVDHLHSDITGARRPGAGFALKQHQRQWALDRGLHLITWTYDPLLTRNAHFNLCKLGARITDYRTDFYGDRTDRLLVAWQLDEPWDPAVRRYAVVLDDAELITTAAGRLPVRERFLALLGAGYRVAGLTRSHEYVLLPVGTPAQYEP